MDYQAWGQAREIIADTASKAGIRNRFLGQYQDQESGLHYNRYRYYDPGIGRFISRDPIGLMGDLNIHSCAPNPIEWVAPLGLKSCLDKAKCKTLLANVYKKALAEKKKDGSRGLKERIDHLNEDTYKLYDFAPGMSDARNYGNLKGKGSYEGHIRAARQLRDGLQSDIRDFDEGGCNQHYTIPNSIHTIAKSDIPIKPAGTK